MLVLNLGGKSIMSMHCYYYSTLEIDRFFCVKYQFSVLH